MAVIADWYNAVNAHRMTSMRLNLKVKYQLLILVAVPTALNLVFIWELSDLLRRANWESERHLSSKMLVAKASEISHTLVQAALCLVMYKSVHSESSLTGFDKLSNSIGPQFEEMRKYCDPKREGSRVEAIDHVRKLQEISDKVFYLMHNFRKPSDPAEFMLIKADPYRVRIKKACEEYLQEFQRLEGDENTFQQSNLHERTNLTQYLLLGVGLNMGIAVALILYFTRNITAPLATLTANNWRLARREPLLQRISGKDEIAELDRGFHAMAKALYQAERRKQEFVQMISHDLRTPLTSIQGTLALALRGSYGNLNEKGATRLADAEADTERLINLISELLDIEKLEAGKLDLECEDTSLAEIINRSIDSVRTFAETHGINLIYDGTDCSVFADKDRVIRVLVNLLSNAVKYSPRDSNVAVSVEKDTAFATVKIVDSGRGIPASAIESIFDRFAQVERADADKGTGLGLAICKAIVAAHGCKIGVTSEEGKGSTFWFTLRVSGEPSGATAPGAGSETEAPAPTPVT